MCFFTLDQNQLPPTSRSWPVHSRVTWPHVQRLRSCSCTSLCDSAPITLFSARRSRVRSYWRPLKSRPYTCASVQRFTRPLISSLFFLLHTDQLRCPPVKTTDRTILTSAYIYAYIHMQQKCVLKFNRSLRGKYLAGLDKSTFENTAFPAYSIPLLISFYYY